MSRFVAWAMALAAVACAVVFVPLELSWLDGAREDERPKLILSDRDSATSAAISRSTGKTQFPADRNTAVARTSTIQTGAIGRTGARAGQQAGPLPSNAFGEKRTEMSGSARVALTRALQRHLRRVGCYTGPTDGDWGPATKYAMGSFVKSVNAFLPADQPDFVLLSLLKRHRGAACGAKNVTTKPQVASSQQDGWVSGRTETPLPPGAGAPRTSRVRGNSSSSARATESASRAAATEAPRIVSQTAREFGSPYDSRMSLGSEGVLTPAAPGSITRPSGVPSATPRTRDVGTAARRNTKRRRHVRQRSNRSRKRRSRAWKRQVFDPMYQR